MSGNGKIMKAYQHMNTEGNMRTIIQYSKSGRFIRRYRGHEWQAMWQQWQAEMPDSTVRFWSVEY
jgi:hypothetical protein